MILLIIIQAVSAKHIFHLASRRLTTFYPIVTSDTWQINFWFCFDNFQLLAAYSVFVITNPQLQAFELFFGYNSFTGIYMMGFNTYIFFSLQPSVDLKDLVLRTKTTTSKWNFFNMTYSTNTLTLRYAISS